MDFTKNFLFYDYETFGLDTALDKAAQFASVRTDLNFNILDEKILYCIPSIDYLPNPESVLITKITPKFILSNNGLIEHHFAKEIYRILMKSNTCILGFNNLNFDDEITKNLFFRNFFDSYEWFWKNNNSRWDVLNLLRACCILRPENIIWPKNEFGNFIFNLSKFTKKNRVLHDNAHNAISDVYATIASIKILKNKKPKLFKFLFYYRKKKKLLSLITNSLDKPLIYVSNIFGANRNHVGIISIIGWHPNNKNIVLYFDLSNDISVLLDFFSSQPIESWTLKKLFFIGINFIYTNKCPVIVPIRSLNQLDYNRLVLDDKLCVSNFMIFKKNIFFIRKKIFDFFSNEKKYLNINENNIDLQLYSSFFSIIERKNIKKLQSLIPKKINFVKSLLTTDRLKKLFFNFQARNYPHLLNDVEKLKWKTQCLKIINKKTSTKYKEKIMLLLKKYEYKSQSYVLLEELIQYMEFLIKRINNY